MMQQLRKTSSIGSNNQNTHKNNSVCFQHSKQRPSLASRTMVLSRRNLTLAFTTILFSSTTAQVDNETHILRRGRGAQEADDSTSGLLPLRTRGQNDEIRRIVVKCQEDQDQEECLENIIGAAPKGSVKVMHKLNRANSFAISVKSSGIGDIDNLGFDMYDDPIRQPLHIKESIQLHRELQYFGQATPYGIDMVKAQEVWDQFGVKGNGVKVCVMDTGLRAGHMDLTSSKMSGYSGNEAITPWDRDGDGHGTHVTGTIAAEDNNRGVVGVAPEVEIYTVRVFDSSGLFFGSDVVAAADRAPGKTLLPLS